MDILTLRHKHAAAYLIGAGRGWVMYDAGWPDSFPAFRTTLKEKGIRFEDIRYLVISHFHMDHAGAAETLKEHGIALLFHEAQAEGPQELNRFFLRKPDTPGSLSASPGTA